MKNIPYFVEFVIGIILFEVMYLLLPADKQVSTRRPRRTVATAFCHIKRVKYYRYYCYYCYYRYYYYETPINVYIMTV